MEGYLVGTPKGSFFYGSTFLRLKDLVSGLFVFLWDSDYFHSISVSLTIFINDTQPHLFLETWVALKELLGLLLSDYFYTPPISRSLLECLFFSSYLDLSILKKDACHVAALICIALTAL